MTYRGHIHNGQVVLDEPADLPEGAEVRVDFAEAPEEEDSFVAAVLKLAKPRPHWPADYALNHGHYIHGAPKR